MIHIQMSWQKISRSFINSKLSEVHQCESGKTERKKKKRKENESISMTEAFHTDLVSIIRPFSDEAKQEQAVVAQLALLTGV